MPTVSDNFNRANETPIGSPWASSIGGGANLTNNALTSVAGSERLSFYTGTFVADQESYGTVGNLLSNSQYAELAVRMDANGNAFVLFTDGNSGAGSTELGVFANGLYSTLAGVATTFANGDRMRLTVSGASPNITLTAYKDTGGGWVQVGQITGVSGPNSGNPGAGAFGTATIDDWTGTDGGGAAPSLPPGLRGDVERPDADLWYAARDWRQETYERPTALLVPSGGGIAGSASVTLAGATPSASGVVDNRSSAAVTVAGASASAGGVVDNRASAAVTLAGVTPSASGVVDNRSSGAVTLSGATAAASGVVDNRSYAAVTLAGATVSAVGTVGDVINGTAAVTLSGAIAAASGVVDNRAAAAVALAGATASASGVVDNRSSAAATLAGAIANASGSVGTNDIIGTAAPQLTGAAANGVAQIIVSGAAAVALAGAAASATGISGSGLTGIASRGRIGGASASAVPARVGGRSARSGKRRIGSLKP